MKQKTKTINQLKTSKMKLMSKIMTLDLPLFLLVEISLTLDTLNEYKFYNITINEVAMMQQLTELQQLYVDHITHYEHGIQDHITRNHHGLLTLSMIDRSMYPICNQQESCAIKTLFSVRCLLMIMEVVNNVVYRK